MHVRSQDYSGWLDLDLGKLCTTFATAVLAPMSDLQTAGQQWVSKHMQILASLRNSVSNLLRGWRKKHYFSEIYSNRHVGK